MDMTCRALVVALFACGALLGLASPASSDPAVAGSSFYVVQGDPRLCPSPLCGGYWVALANRARIRCSDGALRPRCYVAQAIGDDRRPLGAGLPDGSLVRAEIASRRFGSFGELGALVVADVWAPVGGGAKGDYFRARDLGVRCVRAPCFSIRTTRVNGTSRITVSSLDLLSATASSQPTRGELARAQAALTSTDGLFVLGRIIRTGEAGSILQASRIYLRAAKRRA